MRKKEICLTKFKKSEETANIPIQFLLTGKKIDTATGYKPKTTGHDNTEIKQVGLILREFDRNPRLQHMIASWPTLLPTFAIL